MFNLTNVNKKIITHPPGKLERPVVGDVFEGQGVKYAYFMYYDGLFMFFRVVIDVLLQVCILDIKTECRRLHRV